MKQYIHLLISTSFFNACVELGIGKIHQGINNIYNAVRGSDLHKRMFDLLKVCYSAYAKYQSDFKISKSKFIYTMLELRWEHIFFDKESLAKCLEDSLPGFPEELPRIISETKLSEIEKIPEEIPGEKNDENFVRYMLNTIRVIATYHLDYNRSKDYLLLEHFSDHDKLLGVDSDDEHYYVKKLIDNHALPSGSIEPHNVLLHEKEFADLKVAS